MQHTPGIMNTCQGGSAAHAWDHKHLPEGVCRGFRASMSATCSGLCGHFYYRACVYAALNRQEIHGLSCTHRFSNMHRVCLHRAMLVCILHATVIPFIIHKGVHHKTQPQHRVHTKARLLLNRAGSWVMQENRDSSWPSE